MEAAINFTTCGALHNPEVTSSISRWLWEFLSVPFSLSFAKSFLFALSTGLPKMAASVGANVAAWALTPKGRWEWGGGSSFPKEDVLLPSSGAQLAHFSMPNVHLCPQTERPLWTQKQALPGRGTG